jgi:hypothetical protein
VKHLLALRPIKIQGMIPQDSNESALPALGGSMSPAQAHGRPHAEDLVLPKLAGNGNFILTEAVVWWIDDLIPA